MAWSIWTDFHLIEKSVVKADSFKSIIQSDSRSSVECAMSEGRQSFRKGSINEQGANVVQGIEAKVKASAVFTQSRIPPALFPLATIEEFGFNNQSGIFWMKQKTKSSKEFAHAEIVIMYAPTLSGIIEKNKIKNLKGFKVKEMKGRELFLSVPYDEIYIDDDEVHLRSQHHTTRNCMLVSFSDNPPPPRHPDPPPAASAAAPPPPAADPNAAAPSEETAAAAEGAQEGEAEAGGEGEAPADDDNNETEAGTEET